MVDRTTAITEGTNMSGGYVRGDYDPANFSYNSPISRDELLSLSLRNSKIQKGTAWFASEIMRERWEFKNEQPIISLKHKVEYTFERFNEWLTWIGAMKEYLKAIYWSLLFGDAIIVHYDGNESNLSRDKRKKFLLPEATDFIKCKAFYRQCKGNGYTIEDVDDFTGIPTQYKIKLQTEKAKRSITYYVNADRVVRFSAPQKELKYSGTSNVITIVKDCIVQEQIKRAVAVSANMLQKGILAVKASNEIEKNLVDAEIGDSFSYLRRIYYTNPEDVDKLFKLIVPDLKIDQLAKLNDIFQVDIATGIDIAKSNLEGAPEGAISSASQNTLNTYSKVKQLQAHYQRSMEESFFKLGKLDTVFESNDPTPKVSEPIKENEEPTEDEKDYDENTKDDNKEDTKDEDEEEDETPSEK